MNSVKSVNNFLFQDNSPFSFFFYSVLKVFVMTVGEVDYQDMFYSNNEQSVSGPLMGHLLYALFVILICIILMNIFVGLTVSDIQVIRRTIYYTGGLEEKLSSLGNLFSASLTTEPHCKKHLFSFFRR
jgi:hypothetical protein